MPDIEKLSTVIKDHVTNVKAAYKDGSIEDMRNNRDEIFEVIEIDFPFGKRTCLRKKAQESYLMLQKSRGGSVSLEKDLDLVTNIEYVRKNSEFLEEFDQLRYNELKEIERLGVAKPLTGSSTFAELGFRVPRLLKHFQDKHGMIVRGFDVIDANIAAAQLLGYDARKYDFNECQGELALDDVGLVVSYHMLEHVTNPLAAVKKIFNSMKPGGGFHVEIPVEPGVPNVRYCHMYPFHPEDMGKMLEIAGFQIHTVANAVPDGGPWVERYFAVKPTVLDGGNEASA